LQELRMTRVLLGALVVAMLGLASVVSYHAITTPEVPLDTASDAASPSCQKETTACPFCPTEAESAGDACPACAALKAKSACCAGETAAKKVACCEEGANTKAAVGAKKE
jgi:hypothetical protein